MIVCVELSSSIADIILGADGSVTTKGARGAVKFATQADSVQQDTEAAYYGGAGMANPSDAELCKEVASRQSYRFLKN